MEENQFRIKVRDYVPPLKNKHRASVEIPKWRQELYWYMTFEYSNVRGLDDNTIDGLVMGLIAIIEGGSTPEAVILFVTNKTCLCVGRDWLEKNLSEEEFSDFAASKLMGIEL